MRGRFWMSLLVILMLAAGGCSSHRTRIDCGARLSPINAPAAAAHTEARQP